MIIMAVILVLGMGMAAQETAPCDQACFQKQMERAAESTRRRK